MPEASVTEREAVAHVFVLLDEPFAAAGVAAVRGMWDRFRAECAADRPVGAAVASTVPPVLPAAPPHGSVLVAAVQDAAGRDQAVVRREHEVLAFSLLLGARPGRDWPEADRRIEAVLGPSPAGHLGTAVLRLGKTEGAPDTLDLSETGTDDDTRPIRRFVLLGRPGQDSLLSAWAWSAGGSPAMPPFVRYLMHLAKIRHQLRVRSRLPSTAELGRDGLRGAVAGPAAFPARYTAVLRTIRHTVDLSWDNALRALGTGARQLTGTAPLDDDRALAAWFVRGLDDDLAYLEVFHQAAAAWPARGPVGEPLPAGALTPPPASGAESAAPLHAAGAGHPGLGSAVPPPLPAAAPAPGGFTAPGRPAGSPRVLAVADEWFPAHGGLSMLNRQLCIALARAGAEVHALVPSASPAEWSDAEAAGVRLVEAAPQPGMSQREALMRRPVLPGGAVPDVVIGHGRVTGPAARVLSEDHFPRSVRLHVVHVEPDQVEWHKLDRADDAGARAEERTGTELELGRGALRMVPVGPRLEQWLLRDLPVIDGMPGTLRIDPGFDAPAPARPRTPPAGVPQVLAMGRLEDQQIKGLDIVGRAMGVAARSLPPTARWELLVRGAPPDQSAPLRAAVRAWVGHPAVSVTVRPYAADPVPVRRDVARASLVLMPSRAEAFGLVGLEAIVAGVPVLVSANSGLGMLLCETLPEPEWRRVVLPVDDDLEQDAQRWGQFVTAVLFDPPAAFARAAALRKAMAARVTWAAAAERVLECVRAGRRAP